MKLEVGNSVIWASQANGSMIEKVGDVVDVIPAGVSVKKSQFAAFLDAPGMPRKEESYIVCVGPKPGSRAKPKYYWPRVSALKKLR